MSILLASMLFGCKKEVQISEPLSQTISNDVTAIDLSKCKIRRIYQPHPTQEGQTVSALFSYNKAGNPYSVIYSNGGTGVYDHYFIYDSQNRLIEYQARWRLYPDVIHYYKYNDKNQIIVDSFKRSDGQGVYPYETVSKLEYDALGRVVKATVVNTKNGDQPLNPIRRPTYTYDNRGNLGVNGWKSSSYDYKVNPLRQSPVFQFVSRNYSNNNAAKQARYNSLGLPLSMNPSNDTFFNDLVTLKVIYDCQ